MSLGRRGSSAFRVPQFTLSPRLWVCVTDVAVIAERLSRDLGKLSQEGSPEPQSQCGARPGWLSPRAGLTSLPPSSPFQPLPLEPGPLLHGRRASEPSSVPRLPHPHVPRIFSTRLLPGRTRRAPLPRLHPLPGRVPLRPFLALLRAPPAPPLLHSPPPTPALA